MEKLGLFRFSLVSSNGVSLVSYPKNDALEMESLEIISKLDHSLPISVVEKSNLVFTSQINNFEHLQALVLIDPTNGYSNNDVQLSSFVNNTDNIQLYSILYFQEQVNCYMCNILQTKGYQIFYASGNLRVYDSCILDNECTYLVYLGSSSYSAYFYNCTCQNSTSNSQGTLITYSVPSSSFLHALDLLQTAYCIAEYDYLDDLKPYILINKDLNKNDDDIELLQNRKLKRNLFY